MAYKRAMKYLAVSPKTTTELVQYLMKSGVQNSIAESIIIAFTEKGWLNDLTYSQRFIEKAFHEKKKGRLWIEQALLRKGINEDVVNVAFTEYEDMDTFVEVDEALNFARNAILSNRFKSGNILQKLFQTLSRRGYSQETIERVFRELNLDLS